jgi:HKD family nuclease
VRIGVIAQSPLAGTARRRVGDVLVTALADPRYDDFRFGVAYMRASGINRLAAALDDFVSRGGKVSGAIGLDDEVTTAEALQALLAVSNSSTVFHTVSGFIYHPKLYVLRGAANALVTLGSANLTRDGLYRNVELATVLELDLNDATDRTSLADVDAFLDPFLDTSNANVQELSESQIAELLRIRLVKTEAKAMEPGIQARRNSVGGAAAAKLFPPLSVPVAPPASKSLTPPAPSGAKKSAAAGAKVSPAPLVAGSAATFVMELSPFDSSHRTGVRGTAEVLIPNDAAQFFPPIALSGRKYPDAVFDVALNIPTGQELLSYRFWYYETRATGKKIDEHRLSVGHRTIDLTSPGGGDLLVINRLPRGTEPAYEVTIVAKGDPGYERFTGICNRLSQDKRWGIS